MRETKIYEFYMGITAPDKNIFRFDIAVDDLWYERLKEGERVVFKREKKKGGGKRSKEIETKKERKEEEKDTIKRKKKKEKTNVS